MTPRHQEFQSQLKDAEKLRLYVESAFVDQKTRNLALKEGEPNELRWELESKEAA